jgi:hypothetical protein
VSRVAGKKKTRGKANSNGGEKASRTKARPPARNKGIKLATRGVGAPLRSLLFNWTSQLKAGPPTVTGNGLGSSVHSLECGRVKTEPWFTSGHVNKYGLRSSPAQTCHF